jgi:hypothetical protein
MAASSLLTARITHLEPAGADSFLLSWAAPDDHFDAVLRAVHRLPWQQRKYVPAARAWLVHRSGLAWLASRWPALDEALAELDAETRQQQQQQQQRGSGAKTKRGPRRRSAPATDTAAAPTDEIPPEIRAAFGQLHLLPSAPAPVVQAVYRALARQHHPDTGGELEIMKAVNLAYATARVWAEHGAS